MQNIAPLDRRLFLAGAIATMTTTIPATAVPAAESTAIPPGNPGDFAFLTGEWRIHNRFRENGLWIEFPGEATVVEVMGGVGSVEDLRIPTRNFYGMGLRLLDASTRIWSDHFVNKTSGAVSVPGQQGGFVDGVGTFTSEDGEGATRTIYRGIWDRITATSCRWYQSSSTDGGATWDDSWYMDWSRVG